MGATMDRLWSAYYRALAEECRQVAEELGDTLDARLHRAFAEEFAGLADAQALRTRGTSPSRPPGTAAN